MNLLVTNVIWKNAQPNWKFQILTKKVKRVFNFNFNQILNGFADKEAIFYESIKKPFPNPAFRLVLMNVFMNKNDWYRDTSHGYMTVTVVKSWFWRRFWIPTVLPKEETFFKFFAFPAIFRDWRIIWTWFCYRCKALSLDNLLDTYKMVLGGIKFF